LLGKGKTPFPKEAKKAEITREAAARQAREELKEMSWESRNWAGSSYPPALQEVNQNWVNPMLYTVSNASPSNVYNAAQVMR